MVSESICLVSIGSESNGVARTLKKLRTPKRDYNIKQWFSSIASHFKMGTSLKEAVPYGMEHHF